MHVSDPHGGTARAAALHVQLDPTKVIATLESRWPKLFDSSSPKPLSRDILRELVEALQGEVELAALSSALKRYREAPAYIEALAAGGERRGLCGPSGKVEEGTRTHALRMLHEGRARPSLTLYEVRKRFGEAFHPNAPRLLARSAETALANALGDEFSAKSIKKAFHRHVNSRPYLRAMIAGAPVYSLSGEVVGTVTPEQEELAKEKLKQKDADGWRAMKLEGVFSNLKSGAPIGSDGQLALLAAIEHEGCAPREFAAEHELPRTAVQRVYSEALALRESKRTLVQSAVDQFYASGKTVREFAADIGVSRDTLRTWIRSIEARKIQDALESTAASQRHPEKLTTQESVPGAPSGTPVVTVRKRRFIARSHDET